MVAVLQSLSPVETIAAMLAEHGPLPEHDVARRLRDAGVSDVEPVLTALRIEIHCPARQLVDDRWIWLPTLLAGRVFTHRVSADEVARDMLTVSPDLDPITALCEFEQYAQLCDGSPVRLAVVGYDDELIEQRGIPEELLLSGSALLLAPGTMQRVGAAEGNLIGLRLSSQGLDVELIGTPTRAAEAALGSRLAQLLEADEPTFLPAAVWTACVEDRAVFTEPMSPLQEMLDHFGLAHDGDWLARGGFDFPAWRFECRCELLAERHHLEPDDAVGLGTLIAMYEHISGLFDTSEHEGSPQDLSAVVTDDAESPVELAGEFGAVLSDPLLAELLVAETVDVDPTGAAALGLLAEMLEPTVPHAARAAVRWLRAVALQRVGEVDAAERELLATEALDTDCPLALFDLARIASDRGDAERGLALLRRAGADPDHPLVELLEQHRAQPRSDVGRNDACWCGSGRKYKKCHLDRETLPLAARATWLYGKAIQHVAMAGWNDLLIESAYARCQYDDDDGDAAAAAMSDPLVMDAVLFEGGAFAEFLRMRGSLLPDDERALAERWLLIDRSLFEIEAVRAGQGFTVRDVRTGDTHDVSERTAGRGLEPGQLICARVVPAADDTVIFGGVEPVAPHERDSLIDLLDNRPDAPELVAALSCRFAEIPLCPGSAL
ncbi:zinc-binding protein [Mycobacterium asiaticum]|uniref:Zinc-binding protein n=1 Tax=Mycobacterium asiaticum TaxID=1790 RepID=A0A1A3N0D7_MYCAS|nr:zinc-binding protein [Mycobacterium asiaticum]